MSNSFLHFVSKELNRSWLTFSKNSSTPSKIFNVS
jgi:hypothetical protein